jgi:GntR family transcriptional regulator, N-acetylglucosamine utilization regulator
MKREQPAQPLYEIVMRSIQKQIETGVLHANDKIPSEKDLGIIYSVGRNTVRRAISELVNDGTLHSVPGVGTFVVDKRVDKTTEYLFGFSQEMQLLNKKVTSRVLEAKLIPADSVLSRRLQIQLGAEVVFLYRLRIMDAEPIAIERAYLPHELCPGILSYDFSTNSLYEILATVYDKRPDHAEQIIEASLATSEVSAMMGLIQPAVVFVFHRETHLATGQVIEYVDSELRSDRFRFFTSLKLYASPIEPAFRRLLLNKES